MTTDKRDMADDHRCSPRRARRIVIASGSALLLGATALLIEVADARLDRASPADTAALMQRFDALRETLDREVRTQETLAQAIQHHAQTQASRRGFVASGNGLRLRRDGGAEIEIDATSVSMSVPGGGLLRLDSSGARLFGAMVRLNGNDGLGLARVGTHTVELVPTPAGLVPTAGTIVQGSTTVLVGD